MAISFVDSNTAGTADDTVLAFTLPTGTQEDDWLLALCVNNGILTWQDETGWTGETQVNITRGFTWAGSRVYHKLAGPSEGNPTFDLSGTESMFGIIAGFRGLDATTPVDAAIQTSGPGGNTANPDPPSITTVTNGAWVVAMEANDNEQNSNGAPYPSGYTGIEFDDTPAGGPGGGMAYKEVATAGAEDPGVFTLDNTEDWVTYTIALRPAESGGELFTRTVTDGIEFEDPTRRARDHVAREVLLLQDQRTSELLRELIDVLLLGDAESVVRLKALLASDALLLGDDRASEVALTVLSGLFLTTATHRIIELARADPLLLSDASVVDKAKLIAVTDRVLLSDARLSELDRRLIDRILTADVLVRAIDHVLSDALLLADSAETQELAAAIQRTVTDGLALRDATLRALEIHRLDLLLLGDEASTETLVPGLAVARTATDSLLLGDARFSTGLRTFLERLALVDLDRRETLLTLLDRVLLSDLAAHLRELLQREGLLVIDSVTAALLDAAAQALVWARLRMDDPMGTTLSLRDPLGVSVYREDLLGIVSGYVRSPDDVAGP